MHAIFNIFLLAALIGVPGYLGWALVNPHKIRFSKAISNALFWIAHFLLAGTIGVYAFVIINKVPQVSGVPGGIMLALIGLLYFIASILKVFNNQYVNEVNDESPEEQRNRVRRMQETLKLQQEMQASKKNHNSPKQE